MRSRMLSILSGFALLGITLLAVPAMAEEEMRPDCDGADDFFRRGYYDDYMQAMKRAAEMGDTECQFRIGTTYRDGLLIPQDFGSALGWYRLAASRGHPFAQFEIGTMYDTGSGVTQDYLEAVRWYRLAANQGFSMAQRNLAVMYGEGLGVPKDKTRAEVLYRLSLSKPKQTF